MQLPQLIHGYLMTQCLYIAAKLNIADHLASGSKSIEQLSILSQAHPESLKRVLRCLVSLGIFQLDTHENFSLNDNARELCSSDEGSLKDYIILCGEELYQSAGQLLGTVQTGTPAFKKLHDMSHWEFLEKFPDKAKLFHDAMEKGSQKMLREIIKHYDFTRYNSIVDVGGGKGHLLCEILSQNSHITGTVFDLIHAEALSNEYINQIELADRCKFISGNFFESVPTGSDLYLLKVVLHDWDDERAISILKNCKNAMHENSKLLIIEKVVSQDIKNKASLLGDINMLVMYAGKERTLAEFQHLLSNAGFRLIRKIDTNTVFSIIEAELA